MSLRIRSLRKPLLRLGFLVLTGFGLQPLVGGGPFPPVPPSTWEIKGGPEGAVVVERHLVLSGDAVLHAWKIRITSEVGREAAGLGTLSSQAFDFQGRTVFPDGREVPFDAHRDLGERSVSTGSGKASRSHWIPPGVTADCLVEFRWKEPLPSYHGRWVFTGPFPIRKLILEVPLRFPMAWSIDRGDGVKMAEEKGEGTRRFVAENLPGVEPIAFGVASLRTPLAFEVHHQPRELRHAVELGPDRYWSEVAQIYYKNEYESEVVRTGAYPALAAELVQGLEGSPVRRAADLLMRLDQRIVNLGSPTRLERDQVPKDFWKGFRHKDLHWAALTGRTNARGMRLLYYHLLKAAGLVPKVALVADRDERFFEWNRMDLWQFSHELIGVEDPGIGTVWFDPTLRFATPGLIHPDYTGVDALVIDTRSWTGRREMIQAQRGDLNVRRFTYALNLEEEGEAFTLKAEFGGFPEYLERHRYMALGGEEQSRVLKDRLEDKASGITFAQAAVQGATEARVGVTWTAAGHREQEGGRVRLVSPFPGMPWPLMIPSKLEKDRKDPIVLPYLSTHVAVATFSVPEGLQLGAVAPVHVENAFGKVFWVLTPEEGTRKVKVVLRVEVSGLTAGPDQWEAFRAFLAAIEEACRKQVPLEKVR